MTTYDLIYSDPAWSYDKKVGQGIADEQYNTMSIEEIAGLRVGDLLKEDGLVYMWITFPFLDQIPYICESWGLEYVTVGFNWIKLNIDGTPFFGIGHHTKSNGEVCVILRKGKGLQVQDNSISQVIMTRRDKHSKKPHACYTHLERLYPNASKLEMFARHRREGWGVWGEEAPKEQQNKLREEY